jgi:hypothetical protein
MGIFKKLLNKVLDAEVPPVIEKLASKNPKYKKTAITPEFGKVMYTERYIPDDSDEAKKIMAEREKSINGTKGQRGKQLEKENRERMQSAGLTMYIWSTAQGERVRPCCQKMEGKLCLLSDPTVYSRNKGKDWIPRPKGATLTHPGEENEYRCTALSYYPELVGEL